MSNQGSPFGRTKLKDASRTCLTSYWQTDLKQGQSKAMAPELWGLTCTTCSVAGGRQPAMWTWDLGTDWTPLPTVIIKGNGIFYRMEALLTQTIETDTPGFYCFGKWWLRKRYFIFWQFWGLERQGGRGNHWSHEWNKQTHETHIKQVLHMVLTRNWDSELYELRNAIILFSRITKYIY